MVTKLRVTIPIRIVCAILAPKQEHRHVLSFQFGRNVWKSFLEVLEPTVAVGRITTRQHPFNLRLFHRKKHRDGDAAGLRQCDVFVDCTLVQVQFPAYRPVRFSIQMETQRLFDLVHFFTFTCHG